MSIELLSRLPGSVLPQARAAESVEAGQHLKCKSSGLFQSSGLLQAPSIADRVFGLIQAGVVRVTSQGAVQAPLL